MDMISGLRYAAQKQREEQTRQGAEKGEAAAGGRERPLLHPELERAFSLAGKVAVITGAARGIGRQAAVTFAQAGADVIVADVLTDALAETAAEAQDAGASVLSRRLDVTQHAEVDALADAVLERFGRLDVWANVAGIIRYSRIVDTTEADLRAVLDVNLLGVYWGVAAAGRVMSGAGSGSIINIASAGGEVPAPNISGYAVSKAAVMHLTRVAATELGEHGIRVNAIAPGFIDTPMVAPYWTREDGGVDPEAREQVMAQRAGQSPLRRTGEPVDITWCMLYLASEASRFMTGQVLRPNGGVVMP